MDSLQSGFNENSLHNSVCDTLIYGASVQNALLVLEKNVNIFGLLWLITNERKRKTSACALDSDRLPMPPAPPELFIVLH
jgi:hypothetical protein